MPLNLAKLRSGHDRFLSAHDSMVSGVLYDAGLAIVAETILNPQFKPRTGKLQRATTTRVVRASNGKVLVIKNAKPYAKPIEEGARAHVIRPRKGKFLRFIGKNGALVFRRVVNHPGNRPYWFLRTAVQVRGFEMRTKSLDAGMRRAAQSFRP